MIPESTIEITSPSLVVDVDLAKVPLHLGLQAEGVPMHGLEPLWSAGAALTWVSVSMLITAAFSAIC